AEGPFQARESSSGRAPFEQPMEELLLIRKKVPGIGLHRNQLPVVFAVLTSLMTRYPRTAMSTMVAVRSFVSAISSRIRPSWAGRRLSGGRYSGTTASGRNSGRTRSVGSFVE